MPKKILEYQVLDGEPLYIEIDDNNNAGEVTRGAGDRGIIQNAKESFDAALKPLKQVSNSIISCIKEISNCPDEVEVELGLKFTAKAGIILTSLDSEAHFRVSFKWINNVSGNKSVNISGTDATQH